MFAGGVWGRVIGLENDDDDRRDDQNQSGRGVEVEAFAEVDDADQYGRQGFHRAEDRSHRRADMLDLSTSGIAVVHTWHIWRNLLLLALLPTVLSNLTLVLAIKHIGLDDVFDPRLDGTP